MDTHEMPDRLIIVECDARFHIQWLILIQPHRIQFGNILGANICPKDIDYMKGLIKRVSKASYLNHSAATVALYEAGAKLYPQGFLWDNLADAWAALDLAKAAVAAIQPDRPEPDWARTAKAAGWKPPKGWKP